MPDIRPFRALRYDSATIADPALVVAPPYDVIDAAEEAVQRIEVEYEELTPVLDPLEAMRPDAPVLHPNFMSYTGRVPGPQEHPNIVAHNTWKNGDVVELSVATDDGAIALGAQRTAVRYA